MQNGLNRGYRLANLTSCVWRISRGYRVVPFLVAKRHLGTVKLQTWGTLRGASIFYCDFLGIIEKFRHEPFTALFFCRDDKNRYGV